MTWAEEMLERATSSDRWSRARWRAEEQWAQIWCPPECLAISPDTTRTVTVDRRKRRRQTEWRQAA